MKLEPTRVRRLATYPKRKFRLGDAIATVARPIGEILGMKDCPGCAHRQQRLNDLGDKVAARVKGVFRK